MWRTYLKCKVIPQPPDSEGQKLTMWGVEGRPVWVQGTESAKALRQERVLQERGPNWAKGKGTGNKGARARTGRASWAGTRKLAFYFSVTGSPWKFYMGGTTSQIFILRKSLWLFCRKWIIERQEGRQEDQTGCFRRAIGQKRWWPDLGMNWELDSNRDYEDFQC